jgi:hypothetical protein
MKSTLRHTFDIGADAFWRDVFFDHEFLERMYKEALGCVSVAFLEDSGDTPQGRTRRLTFAQPLDAPGPIRKIFGATTTMEERGRFDPKAQRWQFTMIPDRMPDKVRVAGETWIVPAGDGKIERVDAIDLSVDIFGVGSLVEKFMASATAESLEKQARFTREYIASRGLGPRPSIG